MRGLIIAAVVALSVGPLGLVAADAAPEFGRATLDTKATASSPIEEARYVVRCHKVRVWRNGHRTWVRRCHRVWVG